MAEQTEGALTCAVCAWEGQLVGQAVDHELREHGGAQTCWWKREGPYFVDDDHARYAGWIIGIARRNGVQLEPVTDDAGNYTDRLTAGMKAFDGRWVTITFVVPPPPEDWVAP